MKHRIMLKTKCGCTKLINADPRDSRRYMALIYNRPEIGFHVREFNQDEMDYVRSAERREFEFRGERFNDSESEMIWIYEEV